MQLTSYSVLSSLFFAAAATVQAAPSADGYGIFQARSHHQVARHHQRRAPHLAPPTLNAKRATNSTQPLQKKCRLRPASSTVTGTIAGENTSTGAPTSTATSTSSSANSTVSQPAATDSVQNYGSPWHLGASHQGASFFDGWTFWDSEDPTGGDVNFLAQPDAWNAGLIHADDGQPAYMRVGTDDYQAKRNSIRIHDEGNTFNINTLLIMDAKHMPVGCGVWPAWWTNGPDWPRGGEIDIVEGINNQQQNQATLHTSDGCIAQSDGTIQPSGQLINANCGVDNGDNSGCGFTDTNNDNSYGQAFNDNGGGVYVMQWVQSGISVWFFPRNSIPDDITAEQPTPWKWNAPFAHWGASSCDPNQFFNHNYAIFDITLCGQWAGTSGSWNDSGCAASTGVDTCSAYIAGLGKNFGEAYWAVNYVKYFGQNT